MFLLASCQNETEKTSLKSSSVDVKVKTESVQLVSNELELKFSGSIEALKTIPISFQTTGTGQKIYVEEGQAVKKNQLLASLDKTDATSSYSIALAKKRTSRRCS